MSLSYLLEVQMYSPRFQKQVLSLRRLEAEVKSLKHDWLMADEVCDVKEEKLRTLTKIATGVVRGKLPLSQLKSYLENQIVTKVRTDLKNLTNHTDERVTEKYYTVNEKNKPFRKIINPDYNPYKKRRTQ